MKLAELQNMEIKHSNVEQLKALVQDYKEFQFHINIYSIFSAMILVA